MAEPQLKDGADKLEALERSLCPAGHPAPTNQRFARIVLVRLNVVRTESAPRR